MQNDESIWSCLNNGHCSFKAKMKTPPTTFCRNKYNSTGLCNRQACPLANSEYGTIIEDEGVCYLFLKTVERAHTPKNMWEKTKLSRNFAEALEAIEKEMEYWPDHKINRCKQRLTKLRQMLLRSRRLEMKAQPKLVTIKKKTEQREMGRELKADTAAKVDLAVEQELLQRLQQGMYGDIYNFNPKAFDKLCEDGEEDELENEEESEYEDEGEMGFAAGTDSEESESEAEDADRKRGTKRRRIEIEYEQEHDTGAVAEMR